MQKLFNWKSESFLERYSWKSLPQIEVRRSRIADLTRVKGLCRFQESLLHFHTLHILHILACHIFYFALLLFCKFRSDIRAIDSGSHFWIETLNPSLKYSNENLFRKSGSKGASAASRSHFCLEPPLAIFLSPPLWSIRPQAIFYFALFSSLPLCLLDVFNQFFAAGLFSSSPFFLPLTIWCIQPRPPLAPIKSQF